MALVIDTSALITLERSSRDLVAALTADLRDETPVVPAIVYAELLVGVELADRPRHAARRRARIEALITHCSIVEFGPSIATCGQPQSQRPASTSRPFGPPQGEGVPRSR